MNNVEFENDEIKELYKSIIKKHRGLPSIILDLVKNDKPITITEIKQLDNGIMILIKTNNQFIDIEIDYSKNKILVGRNHKTYKEIYDDLPLKNMKPIGYLYQKETREITKKVLFDLVSDKEKVRHFEINENGNHYTLILKIKNTIFNEEETIIKLLNSTSKYNSIRDLFISITQFIDINHVDVSIGDAKGSVISIRDGKIENYIEVQKEEEHYNKVYLENDNFYITKLIKEEYQDNFTSFIKKIGERDGKEKRQD